MIKILKKLSDIWSIKVRWKGEVNMFGCGCGYGYGNNCGNNFGNNSWCTIILIIVILRYAGLLDSKNNPSARTALTLLLLWWLCIGGCGCGCGNNNNMMYAIPTVTVTPRSCCNRQACGCRCC